MSIKLIVGLGNPGNEYDKTRHNVGFMFFSLLADSLFITFNKKFKGEYGDSNICGEKVFFLKPLTFMNLSGESVLAFSSFFKIKPEEMLMVYDDIESPFGTISFKNGGGLAGHNGLKSIKQQLGTENFHRLKIGVSRPKHGNVASYVLSKFSSDEEAVLPLILEKAKNVLLESLPNSILDTEKQYNKYKVLA